MGRRNLSPEEIVRLEAGAVVLLDQRRLPDEEVELRCESAAEVADAIRTLAVRGAPAIGVAAAYGYALAAERGEDLDAAYRVLAESRPTAVNLVWALEQMRDDPSAERARALHEAEVDRCKRMGAHAAVLFGPGTKALTHCNAGGLATGGYGSAVGALRAAWEEGLLAHVWVDETRPLLQGARLTAWELEALGVPHAVIADSAAAHLMSRGEVDCIVTGADRIAANGDSANKIGTYGLAVAAAHHRIPLYVVAPTSTIDLATATGAGIPIEERDGAEITSRFEAHNPAFDVTPGRADRGDRDGGRRAPAAVRGVAAAMSVIDEITREVETDPASVGLILHGSRAAGTDREGSDFDLMRVVTDEAYPSCAALREKRTGADGLAADIFYSSPERLSDLAERPDWRVGMLVTGRVLVDRGPLAALVETTLSRAGEHAHAQLDEHYDAYLNCLVRSLKAWRRGDELGGRMQASESALHLVRTLFALEHRWHPYHDQLAGPLRELEATQGWSEGELAELLLRLVRDADPTFQQELELRVEALLESRGVQHQWGPEDDLQPLKEYRFR